MPASKRRSGGGGGGTSAAGPLLLAGALLAAAAAAAVLLAYDGHQGIWGTRGAAWVSSSSSSSRSAPLAGNGGGGGVGGFVREDLAGVREFLRAPTWAKARAGLSEFWAIVGPGGRLHPGWFLEHKGHLVIEGVLAVAIAAMLLQSRYSAKGGEDEAALTDKEVDMLVEEWQPVPLVPPAAAGDDDDARPEPPVVLSRGRGNGAAAFDVVVAGAGGRRVAALNLATADFLGLGGDEGVRARARETVERYGVGSCGPRGFYGTFDVHLDLEEALAAFMGAEEAIIYSYDISTVASVIPAFASRKDVLVLDEGVSFAVQQGAQLSRARLRWFKHNDAADLERVLEEVEREERAAGAPLCRRMIVVEGVYANSGDAAPLREVFALKERYKYRLCVEESHALGVLGATGRGACEAAGLRPGRDVEVVVASMGTALASVGGFCVGRHEVCDHQRLCGQGYCFSASLPPYLATAAREALAVMSGARGRAAAARVRAAAAALRRAVRDVPGLVVPGLARREGGGAAAGDDGDGASGEDGGGDATLHAPLVHLQLAPRLVAAAGSRRAADALAQAVADRLLEKHGLLVAVPRYSALERAPPPPSVKLCVHAGLPPERVPAVAAAVREAAAHALGPLLAKVAAGGGAGGGGGS